VNKDIQTVLQLEIEQQLNLNVVGIFEKMEVNVKVIGLGEADTWDDAVPVEIVAPLLATGFIFGRRIWRSASDRILWWIVRSRSINVHGIPV
jgi:hypothetical protein